MGSKLTILENRTYYNIELRMWAEPSRPDHFEKIIKMKPDGSTKIKADTFHRDDRQVRPQSESVLIMVYANGGWTGKYLFPQHLMTYAKVTCDRNQHGQVILRGTRPNFNFCRLKYFSFLLGKYVGLGMIEGDI
ncbi:hypothetical protein ACH5RR_009493 [Cinchona calisaya]|uniref:Uncharacterized protein n=1 Tax=Cinchona calisaya TaxID=153742 RepID=A0ABD3AGS0_9GENT